MSIVNCPECDTPLVNIASGAICPGCGKSGVFPKVAQDANRLAVRAIRAGQLPKVKRLTTIKAMNASEEGFVTSSLLYGSPDGVTGIYRRIPRESGSLDPTTASEGAILACDASSGRVIELVRYDAALAEIMPPIPVDAGGDE